MKILVDTREQAPLEFEAGGIITEVVRRKLDVGDYGCQYEDGTVVPIFIERKSIGDLWGTMTHGYQRFKEEMVRARDGQAKLILAIEGTLSKVLRGYRDLAFSGESMARKLYTLRVRYDLEVWFCHSRPEMLRAILFYYEAVGREYIASKK